MREIKFRGKFKDNEWEYGGLRFGDMGQAYILPHGATSRVELVNRETVGEFTGFKDVNNAEIYEGDVWVVYSKQIKGKKLEYIEISMENLEKKVFKGWRSTQGEVIGNKFENKEILK